MNYSDKEGLDFSGWKGNGRRRPLGRQGNSMTLLKNKLKLALRFLLQSGAFLMGSLNSRGIHSPSHHLLPLTLPPHNPSCSQTFLDPQPSPPPGLHILAEKTFLPSFFRQPGFMTSENNPFELPFLPFNMRNTGFDLPLKFHIFPIYYICQP